MAFMGRTRAVAYKLVDDIEKLLFWITILVQGFFFFFYGYSIYTNLNRPLFLVIYSLLLALSVFNFIYVIVSHPYRKSDNVKKVKAFARAFKYLVNGTMLGVNIFGLIKFDGTDFNKIMIIVSAASLAVQIILEFVRAYTARYIDLFMTSFQMDLNLVYKLSRIKDAKGNFYGMVDAPLEAIANKIEGKEKEEDLTDTEKELNELLKKYEPKFKEMKDDKKQKSKENSQQKAARQKEQIKKHVKIIKENLFKKKDKDEVEE